MEQTEKIKLFLIDNHVLFRKGLKAILLDYPQLEILGEALNYDDAKPKLAKTPVDIVVIDIDLKNLSSAYFADNFFNKGLTKKVLVLTFARSRMEILRGINAGANGYLLKNEEIDVLLDSFKKIMQGNFVLSDGLVSDLIHFVAEKNDLPIRSIFSKREIEILELIKEGKSNPEISQTLFISENTVKTHIKNLYKKLSVSSRKESIEKGILWGIIN
jgi:DNA-binding NarL/FixJ family response regulator